MACLSEVRISMFVDLHASALLAETRKNVWLRRLVAGLLSRRTRFHSKPVHVGICIGQTGAGAVDSILSVHMRYVLKKTGTRTLDSIPDQPMWDLCSTTGTGAADSILGQSTWDVRRTSGTKTGSSPSNSVSPCQCHPTNSLTHSYAYMKAIRAHF
jgi:hypothetical protein